MIDVSGDEKVENNIACRECKYLQRKNILLQRTKNLLQRKKMIVKND